MKTTKYLMMIVMLALILTACAGGPTTQNNAQAEGEETPAETVDSFDAVIVEGRIVPARDATLSFQGRGTVVKVDVKVGDKVKAGDVLARLGDVADATYAAAQLELVSAQQSMDDLLDTENSARAQALIALDDAEEAYDKTVDYYDTLFEPYEFTTIVYRRIVTPLGVRRIPDLKKIKVDKADDETIADAEENMALKLAQFEEAQRAYERVKEGPDKNRLAILEARLNAAKAGVAAFEITAPFSGEIMDINVSVGDQVGPETWAIKLADTSTWYVETNDLTELEIVEISVGQPATILADALPDAPMQGIVDFTSETFTLSGGDILYEVKVRIDSKEPRAKWGMTVEVTFEPPE